MPEELPGHGWRTSGPSSKWTGQTEKCKLLFHVDPRFFSGERHEKERGMPKARSQGSGRGGDPQIPLWRTRGLPYHFSQGIGAIPDVGLLEVDFPEPAGMMGARSHPCPFRRQRAGEKKRETATAAEEDPSWEVLGQGQQRGHGSRSKVVRPSRLQLQHSALTRDSSVSIRESGQGKGREAQRLQALPLLWFLMCSAGGEVHLI